MTNSAKRPASTAAANAGDGLYSALARGRRSEAVADQIRALIDGAQLVSGDRLPSERDLSEQMDVSRVTIREALRMLEANGLVSIRVGHRGGAFVTSPSSEDLGNGLAALMSLSPMTAGEVTEARQILEIGIIPTVIERATESDVAELRDMVKRHRAALADGTYTMSLSADFHVRIAACSHNAAIEMLVHSFHGPLVMSLEEAQLCVPRIGERGAVEHHNYVEAIASRDLKQAEEIMRTHLNRTARRVAER